MPRLTACAGAGLRRAARACAHPARDPCRPGQSRGRAPSPTGPVYRAYDAAGAPGGGRAGPELPGEIADAAAGFAALLARTRNDLQTPAVALVPAIGAVLDVLEAAPETLFARMSGSGATCFALCGGAAEAAALAARLGRTGTAAGGSSRAVSGRALEALRRLRRPCQWRSSRTLTILRMRARVARDLGACVMFLRRPERCSRPGCAGGRFGGRHPSRFLPKDGDKVLAQEAAQGRGPPAQGLWTHTTVTAGFEDRGQEKDHRHHRRQPSGPEPAPKAALTQPS